MRIGIAGLGFGVNLLNTCLTRDDCVLAGVTDHFPERMEGAAAKGIATYGSVEDLVDQGDLDALVIASAPHVRGPAFDAAFAAGLPVFVEKPLAGTPDQADAMVRRCDGQRVMVGFSFRFHAPVQALAARVAAGDLGAPMLANGEYLFDWLPPADNWLWDAQLGGGFFTENSCHLLDVVMTLLGQARRVHAEAVEDTRRPSATGAAVTLAFETGARAALTIGGIGTGTIKGYPRLNIAFAGGQAKLHGREHMWTGLTLARRGHPVEMLESHPEALARTRYSDAFDHFIAGLRDATPFAATPEDGARAVHLAAAIYRAIETGQPQDL